MATHHISQLLGKTLTRYQLKGGFKRARAILVWPEVVGGELSRLTRAVYLQDKTLWIEVQDSVMAHHLGLQSPVFLERLQAKLSDKSVLALRFRVGQLPEAPPKREIPGPLPKSDQQRLEHLVSGLKPELQSAARQAAEAIFKARAWRERQGWTPCPVCGTHSERRPLCIVCQDLLGNPQVQAATLSLRREPDLLENVLNFPYLSADALEVARYSALRQLEGAMDELAFAVVSSGGDATLREFLEGAAHTWLALELRKPLLKVSRRNYGKLPEKVANVLSSGA